MSEKVEKAQEEVKQQNNNEVEESQEGKKEPETLSEGERMGLSKQQLRKLEKKLKKKEKDAAKEEEKAKPTHNKDKDKKAKAPKQQQEVDQAYRQQFSAQKIHLEANKSLPQEGQQNILITSALPYVNNVPHLGNIIGCVLSADVYSRYKKLQGANVLYICGTDEYGTATEVKAIEEKKTPREICDTYFKIHSEVYKWFDIGFDYFGRTSTEWHTRVVQEIFLDVHKQGKIAQQEMTQCYCQKCQLFLADRFIVGICPSCQYPEARGDQCDKCQKLFNSPTELVNYACNICKNPPVIKSTTHLFLNLPEIQEELEAWVKSASKEWSFNSVNITNAWINMGLKTKCITRDLKWGVPVPIEEFKSKVFYVWFDAPIGYISITANHLQEDYKAWWQNKDVKLYQFMGKDNVPFHTVIFPSSLIASQRVWTMLHAISTTEYLNYEGGKFSKTHSTGVFGNHTIELEKDLPSEVWRYYLLVNRPQHSDSEFSWKDFADKNNNELLANLGNLVHRALQFIYGKCEKTIPTLKRDLLSEFDIDFITELKNRYVKYRELMDKVELKEGLKFAMEISSRGNKYLQQSKFWEEQNRKQGRTDVILNIIANFIRFQSFLIEPFMPSTAAKINYLLGLEERTPRDATLGGLINHDEQSFTEIFLSLTQKSKTIRQPIPLFNIITEQQVAYWRQRFGGKLKPKENKTE